MSGSYRELRDKKLHRQRAASAAKSRSPASAAARMTRWMNSTMKRRKGIGGDLEEGAKVGNPMVLRELAEGLPLQSHETMSPIISGLANIKPEQLNYIFEMIDKIPPEDIPPEVAELGSKLVVAMSGMGKNTLNPPHKTKKLITKIKVEKKTSAAAIETRNIVNQKNQFSETMEDIKQVVRELWEFSGRDEGDRWINLVVILLVMLGLIYKYGFTEARLLGSGGGKKTRRKKRKKYNKKRSYKKRAKKHHKKTHKKH